MPSDAWPTGPNKEKVKQEVASPASSVGDAGVTAIPAEGVVKTESPAQVKERARIAEDIRHYRSLATTYEREWKALPPDSRFSSGAKESTERRLREVEENLKRHEEEMANFEISGKTKDQLQLEDTIEHYNKLVAIYQKELDALPLSNSINFMRRQGVEGNLKEAKEDLERNKRYLAGLEK